VHNTIHLSARNYAKYIPISDIFSLADTAINLA